MSSNLKGTGIADAGYLPDADIDRDGDIDGDDYALAMADHVSRT